ncbi:MAG: phosphatase PAP2 family protein [Ectothiorhodospiraceae bacterium]|nr:phosphatase PAP2 family protein [Ectothiorhodospiraceae bacterium]
MTGPAAHRVAVVAPVACLGALAVALALSGADRAVLDSMWDAAESRWWLRDGLWTDAVLHDGGRRVIQAFALGLAGWLVLAWTRPSLRAGRPVAGYLLLSLALAVGIVNLGKRATTTDCPWSLVRYGGTRPEVGLLEPRPPALPPGHCFPGGHSSGGFALLGLYVAARARGWRRAPLWLVPGAGLGVVFAAVQWVRGAHFPSHDATSAAICWLVAAGLGRLMLSPPAPSSAPVHGARSPRIARAGDRAPPPPPR